MCNIHNNKRGQIRSSRALLLRLCRQLLRRRRWRDSDHLDLEKLDELLVVDAHFRAGIAAVPARKGGVHQIKSVTRRACVSETQGQARLGSAHSSRIETRFHLCSFRNTPTTTPVRWRPWLHMTAQGTWAGSRMSSSASRTASSLRGSYVARNSSAPTWCHAMLFSFKKSRLVGGGI